MGAGRACRDAGVPVARDVMPPRLNSCHSRSAAMAPTWAGRAPILVVCAAVITFAAWQRFVAARVHTLTRSPAWVHVKSPLFRIGNPMVLVASTCVAIQAVIGLVWEYQDGMIAGYPHIAYSLFGAVGSTAEGCVVFAVEYVVFRYAQRFVRFRQPTSAFKMKPPRWLRPLQMGRAVITLLVAFGANICGALTNQGWWRSIIYFYIALMCLISLAIVWLAAASVVQLEARSAAAQSAAARHVEMDNDAKFEPDHGEDDNGDDDDEEQDDGDGDSARAGASGDHVPPMSTSAWSCPSSPGPVFKFKITVAMLTIALPLCVWKMLEQGRRFVLQDILWDPFPTMAIDSAAALLLIAFMLIGCWLSFIPNSFSLACDSLVALPHDAASDGSSASYLRAAQDDDDGEGDPKIISLIRTR